jgi:hypothetical protein
LSLGLKCNVINIENAGIDIKKIYDLLVNNKM